MLTTPPCPRVDLPAQVGYALRTVFRIKSVLIWALVFPILLSTIFSLMLPATDAEGAVELDAVSLGVLADDAYEGATLLREVLDGASASADVPLALVESADEAALAAQVLDGSLAGYLSVDASGEPTLHLPSSSGGLAGSGSVDAAVLEAVVGRYLTLRSVVRTLAEKDPAALADGGAEALAAFSGDAVATVDADVLHTTTNGWARYYDALLGYASAAAGCVALFLVARLRPVGSAVAARRLASGTPLVAQLAATLAASWAATFGCLLAAFAWVRLVLGVEFGGREALVVVTLACAAVASCALGSLVASVGRLAGTDLGEGLLSGLACLLALLAGLFGTPSMALADWVGAHAPALAAINPVAQVARALYALRYYDSLAPYLSALAGLLALSCALAAASVVVMGRKHARL